MGKPYLLDLLLASICVILLILVTLLIYSLTVNANDKCKEWSYRVVPEEVKNVPSLVFEIRCNKSKDEVFGDKIPDRSCQFAQWCGEKSKWTTSVEGFCFEIGPSRVSKSSGSAYCRANGGQLAVVDSAAKLKAVDTLMKQNVIDIDTVYVALEPLGTKIGQTKGWKWAVVEVEIERNKDGSPKANVIRWQDFSSADGGSLKWYSSVSNQVPHGTWTKPAVKLTYDGHGDNLTAFEVTADHNRYQPLCQHKVDMRGQPDHHEYTLRLHGRKYTQNYVGIGDVTEFARHSGRAKHCAQLCAVHSACAAFSVNGEEPAKCTFHAAVFGREPKSQLAKGWESYADSWIE